MDMVHQSKIQFQNLKMNRVLGTQNDWPNILLGQNKCGILLGWLRKHVSEEVLKFAGFLVSNHP